MTKDFYFSVFNFLILSGILFFVLRKTARAFFRKRSTNTKLEIEKAKKFYDEAYRKLEEVEAKLNNVDVEGRKLLGELKQEGHLEKQRMLMQAKDLSLKIKNDTERTVKQEVLKAKEMLKKETSELVAELATEEIKKNITTEDQKSLSQEFLSEIEKMPKVS